MSLANFRLSSCFHFMLHVSLKAPTTTYNFLCNDLGSLCRLASRLCGYGLSDIVQLFDNAN
jgi:hypothetical protein